MYADVAFDEIPENVREQIQTLGETTFPELLDPTAEHPENSDKWEIDFTLEVSDYVFCFHSKGTEDELIGFCTAKRDPEHYRLYDVCVKYPRNGIGSQMIQAVVDALAQVDVMRSNKLSLTESKEDQLKSIYAEADFDASIFMFGKFMCHGKSHFKGQRFQACEVLEQAEDGDCRMDDHAAHTAFVMHPCKVTSTSAVLKKSAPNSQKMKEAMKQLEKTLDTLVRSGVPAAKLLDGLSNSSKYGSFVSTMVRRRRRERVTVIEFASYINIKSTIHSK